MSRPTRRQVQAALSFYAGEPLPAIPAKPAPRKNDRPEAAALVEVLKALRGHPAVAWCERQNTGATREGDRFIRYGWRGCSDVLGQLKDGRFLAVEVKAPGGRLRPEQAAFLEQVAAAGGVAFVARSCADVGRELAQRRENAPAFDFQGL